MLIGVPKEIKNHEYRVGLTPESVAELVQDGNSVLVEAQAGSGIGASDDVYRQHGAEIVETARDVFDRAEITDLSELARLQLEADIRFATFAGRADDNILAEMRVTERDTGDVEEHVAALLLHLVQHQIHHRGQVHVQLSDAGISPPQLRLVDEL